MARISITASSRQPSLSSPARGEQRSLIVQRAPDLAPRPRVPISPFQLDAQREGGEPFYAGGRVGMRRAATAPQQGVVNPFDGQLVIGPTCPQLSLRPVNARWSERSCLPERCFAPVPWWPSGICLLVASGL